MITPPIPSNESERLAALLSIGLLHTPTEDRFDRITRMAAKLLGVPTAMVSLVAADHQWFKSIYGSDARSTPRDVSFCGHTIAGDGPLVVEDALDDPRFTDNPLVAGGPRIRFYAGQSLRTEGQRVGTLCVVDSSPRRFGDEEVQLLCDLAAVAEGEIQRGVLSGLQHELLHERDELQLKASLDPLTRLWNRGKIMELLEKDLARAKRGTPVSLAMVDVDHFKNVNDTYGHPVGDDVLREIAARIRASIRDIDEAGRYGGEEFLVILSNCDARFVHLAGERIRARVAATPIATKAGPVSVTVSIGVATYGPDTTPSDELVAAVDRALYVAKGNGRNRVEIVIRDEDQVAETSLAS